jgi:hypothetical protein
VTIWPGSPDALVANVHPLADPAFADVDAEVLRGVALIAYEWP